jgi:hypothetical protein
MSFSSSTYADAVPHVHKEVVDTAEVSNGNYSPRASVSRYDDQGNVSNDVQKVHIEHK